MKVSSCLIGVVLGFAIILAGESLSWGCVAGCYYGCEEGTHWAATSHYKFTNGQVAFGTACTGTPGTLSCPVTPKKYWEVWSNPQHSCGGTDLQIGGPTPASVYSRTLSGNYPESCWCGSM